MKQNRNNIVPVDISAFSIDTKILVSWCYLLHVVELCVVDKKMGMGVGSVEAGLVEAGTSILAVTAHLHMIVIRERESTRLHFTQESTQ